MVQLTLATGTEQKEELKVPIFIYTDGAEAKQLAKLIVDVKPSYLLNCSNNVASLRSYINSGAVAKDVVYLMDSTAIATIEEDKTLLTKIEVINLFN